jgi:hypothetical protein
MKGRQRILKHPTIEFRGMIKKYETTQNRRFSETFIEKNIISLNQKNIKKAFKTKKISCIPAIESDIKRREQYCKDSVEFERRFQMDNYELDGSETRNQ